MSYEAVPDVELGNENDGLPSSEALIKAAHERYPAAGSAIEAEFLGRLDDAIANAKPSITIPRLSVEQLGPGDAKGGDFTADFTALVKSLKIPTIALAVTLASALIVVATNNPLTRAIFPYYACILTFTASVPDIRQRFLDSIAPIFNKFNSVKEGVERKVEGISDKGLLYLGITETAMNNALAPVKEKLSSATKLETMLKKIDPTIDIPDTSDIEKSFDGFEDQLTGAFKGMKGMVDLSRSLPAPLQSLAKFQIYIVYPFLAVMLILQLVGVYTSQATNGEVIVLTNATARILFEDDDDFVSKLTNSVDIDSTSAFGEEESDENEWLLMWFAIQSYLTTALQIIIAFLMTQARTMVALANMNIDKLEKNVNDKLKAAVGDVFESIFQKGFGAVKAKFLDLVRKVDKIEQPLLKAQAQMEQLEKLKQIPGAGMFGKSR